MPKCRIKDCINTVGQRSRLGLCKFHYKRYKDDVPFTRPYGVKGENNPNWKGGVSEYPNHYEMKKARKRVLEAANYVCFYCGNFCNQVHHRDLTKNNHSGDNLVACCHKCNHKPGHKKDYKSKYKMIYGIGIEEMSHMVGFSLATLSRLHSSGKLNAFLVRIPKRPYRLVTRRENS